MPTNRGFTLHTSDGLHSQLRRLRNSVPQGSVLDPMLFIYMHELLPTLAKKYGRRQSRHPTHKCWETIEEGLTADMSTLSTYLKNGHLKLSVTNTMPSSLHLNNKEAMRELKGQFKATPTYLGVKLNRTWPSDNTWRSCQQKQHPKSL